MPFALVPEGFKLQKVSKLQQEAIDKYYSSKNIEAFLDGPMSSEMVKTVAIVVTPIILAVLAKRGYEFAEDELSDIFSSLSNLIPEFELPGTGNIFSDTEEVFKKKFG